MRRGGQVGEDWGLHLPNHITFTRYLSNYPRFPVSLAGLKSLVFGMQKTKHAGFVDKLAIIEYRCIR